MKSVLATVLTLLFATSAVAFDAKRITRIGDEDLRRLETPHPAPAVESGRQAWQDIVSYPHASYIAVHFDRFELAPGERVEISTPDGKFLYTFEGLGKPRTGGTFWATHVPGDTCVVTYYGSGGHPGFGYVIDKFAHGYPVNHADELISPGSAEAICGADNSQNAKCFSASEPEIYNHAKAVVRLLVGGGGLCTAWLVGCDGHVMTNNHCITNQTDADNIDYEIMAEGATCGTNCQSDGGCPGTIIASSGTLVKTDVNLDYSLVLLPTNVSATYGFLKLRNAAPVVDERIYVPGHPAGWGKQIAVTSDNPNDQSGFAEVHTLTQPPCVTGSPFNDIDYFADTQGGSSGSPVIAYSDQRVVAIHHCNSGGGLCPNTGVPMNLIIANLQATNNLPNCAIQQFAGTVDLDSTAYLCNDTATITVKDDNLVGNGTQNVTIASTTETTPETVVLAATPPGSATFVGSIPLNTSPATPGNGQLSVQNGDTVTVTYIDADDGAGGVNVPRTDAGVVDCVTPMITNVNATNITGGSAVLNWTTNEPATSLAHYAVSPGPPSSTASDPSLVTSHHLPVSGLSACSTYLYDVSSQDAAGNSASDTNGGVYYAFVTGGSAVAAPTSTDTPLPIPDNAPAGATSTVNVTQNLLVTDADVKVNLTHSFDGDLVLQLISPTGSITTLANRRGSSGENFTNTVFDDEATTAIADGVAPYTGSFKPETALSVVDGINAAGGWKLKAVDQANVDTGTIENWTLTLTLAQVCSPSLQMMSKTLTESCSVGGPGGGNGSVDSGEDGQMALAIRNNGNTTMTNVVGVLSTTTPGVTVTRSTGTYPSVASAAAATNAAPNFAFSVGTGVPCGTLIDFTLMMQSDQGTFSDSFQVRVGAPGTTTTPYASTDVPKPLPDVTTVTSTLSVADTSLITDVNVQVNISHTWDGDVIANLIAPNATRVLLVQGRGGSGDNFNNTIFDDAAATPITSGSAPFAGTFRPEGSLATLNGIAANGVWTLEVRDTTNTDTGTLNAWSVILTTASGFNCSGCGLVAPTAETLNQTFAPGGKSTMQWDPVSGATFYNLYRGQEPTLPALLTPSVDSCKRLSSVGTSTGAVLTEAPVPAHLYWYLVRAANGAGEGPVGNATAGPRSQQSSGACP